MYVRYARSVRSHTIAYHENLESEQMGNQPNIFFLKMLPPVATWASIIMNVYLFVCIGIADDTN